MTLEGGAIYPFWTPTCLCERNKVLYLSYRIAECLVIVASLYPSEYPMLPLPVHGEACSLPTRTFGAVPSSDLNSGPVSQGGHVAATTFCR